MPLRVVKFAASRRMNEVIVTLHGNRSGRPNKASASGVMVDADNTHVIAVGDAIRFVVNNRVAG